MRCKRALLSGCPAAASGLDLPRRSCRSTRRWSARSQPQPLSRRASGSRDRPADARRRRASGATCVRRRGPRLGPRRRHGQYGAYGYALHGWTDDDIVAHYYPGTTLGQAPLKRVRVLLVAGRRSSVVVSSASPFTREGRRRQDPQAAGRQQQLGPGSRCQLAAAEAAAAAAARSSSRRARARSRSATGPTAARFEVSAAPASCRSSTPSASSRTCTASCRARCRPLARRGAQGTGRRRALVRARAPARRRRFDLYPDTRSQVYLGVPAESDSTQRRRQRDRRPGRPLQGQGSQTFFHSTSGGRTAASQTSGARSPCRTWSRCRTPTTRSRRTTTGAR